MGNAPSRNVSGSAPQSPSPRVVSTSAAATSHAHSAASGNHANSLKKEPRRRESIHALSQKATAKASPSLESATAQCQTTPVSSSLQRTAKDVLRSQSTSAAQQPPQTTGAPQLRPLESADKMGNQESKQSEAKEKEKLPKPQSPKPVDIPPAAGTPEKPERNEASPLEALPVPEDDLDQLPPSEYNRPPRVPLPIEEEIYAPGSPIISPQDLKDAVEPLEGAGLPRQTSVLSATTIDEDEEAVEDLQPPSQTGHPGVPTLVEWREGGEKVFITGTFADWDRKIRLHKNGPSKHKDAFSAIIKFQPGTHHLRFLVDGDMKLSPLLPTAVDFAGYLVNYIEVLPEPAQPPPSAPVDIPSGAKQLPDQAQPQKVEYRVPPGLHPPQVLPPTPELIPVHRPPTPVPEKPKDTKPVKIAPVPEKQYHSEIPKFLLDLDAPEDSPRLARATAVVNTLPPPPTLPLFLGKSILNGATPMKDDASVLVMPNHTVLNHLATSSIRNKVLATSATTRYKKKFLTSIMYKPTSDSGD